MTVADAHTIQGKGLAKWISENGGIENIAYPKRSEAELEKIREQRTKIAESYLESLPVLGAVSAKNTSVSEAGFVLLIGKIQPDLSTKIVKVLPKGSSFSATELTLRLSDKK